MRTESEPHSEASADDSTPVDFPSAALDDSGDALVGAANDAVDHADAGVTSRENLDSGVAESAADAKPEADPQEATWDGALDEETPGEQAPAPAGRDMAAPVFEPPRITVIQPLAPLKDVELPKRPPPPEDERALLATWSGAMESALQEGRPSDAVRLAHIILRELPRHLATYYRLTRAAWMLRRWQEGDAWGRRLLRADPASALAWRGVAMAAEYSGDRTRAHARWRRAFECDPYEPEIRAGLVRTSIDLARMPALNAAAQASLYLRGYRWEQAAMSYARLTQIDPRRLDFQAGSLIALWQLRALPDAYDMARKLVQSQPYLLAAWLVIDQEGDANDKALARHPLGTMDPDGDYARMAMGLAISARPVHLHLSEPEKTMIAELTTPR